MTNNLETIVSARKAIEDAGMNASPKEYIGRKQHYRDITDERLEKIYVSVKENHGKSAAKNYVKMVADIPKLSAVEFISTFYALEKNNWKWDKKIIEERSEKQGIQFIDKPYEKTEDDDVPSYVLGANNIKRQFMQRHEKEYKGSFESLKKYTRSPMSFAMGAALGYNHEKNGMSYDAIGDTVIAFGFSTTIGALEYYARRIIHKDKRMIDVMSKYAYAPAAFIIGDYIGRFASKII